MQWAAKTPDEFFEDMRAWLAQSPRPYDNEDPRRPRYLLVGPDAWRQLDKRTRPVSTWVHAPGCSHRVYPDGAVVHLCVDGCKIKAKGGVNAIPRRVWDTGPRRRIRAARRARKQRRGWA